MLRSVVPPSSPPVLSAAPPTAETYTLSLHDALPISPQDQSAKDGAILLAANKSLERAKRRRSEEHTSELQSLRHLVCRLLLEKKKNNARKNDARLDQGQCCEQAFQPVGGACAHDPLE